MNGFGAQGYDGGMGNGYGGDSNMDYGDQDDSHDHIGMKEDG
jgi:hypothetical protein